MELSHRPPLTEQEVREFASRMLNTCKSQREAERKTGIPRGVLTALAAGAKVQRSSFALAREAIRERFHGPTLPLAISHQVNGLGARKP